MDLSLSSVDWFADWSKRYPGCGWLLPTKPPGAQVEAGWMDCCLGRERHSLLRCLGLDGSILDWGFPHPKWTTCHCGFRLMTGTITCSGGTPAAAQALAW
jgi:hypothetical protein